MVRKQADKYYKQVIRHCSQIADNPAIGKQYENLLSGLKGSKINKHIIIYRRHPNDEIEVERILHERMDLNNRFLEK